MEEVIKYFEALEARLAAVESHNAALEEQFVAIRNELGSVKGLIDEMKGGQQEVHTKLVVLDSHLNRMNELLKEAQVRSQEAEVKPAETLAEPEPVKEPEPIKEPEPKTPETPETQENPETQESPETQEPTPAPAPKEQVSPKAAIYGKAVEDIRQAISLGDRFLYQRELFNQNAELMQRTLSELNALGSFDEAVEYISSRFQWDTESNTYQQFLVTLHRRFG